MAIIWNTFVVYENLVPNVKKLLIIMVAKHCETVIKKNAKGKKCSYLKINFNSQKFLTNLLKCKNIRINYPTAWYTQPATA